MKKIFSIVLILLICENVHAQSWIDVAEDYNDVGSNWGYWKTLLWRNDRKGFNNRYRFYPHVSNREYLDCTAYRDVNCENPDFSRRLWS